MGDGHHLHPDGAGFVYLAAVVDVFSRRVLAHRVSITMEADFCIEALEEALAKRGKPDIFNSDQGSQFTSVDFTGVLLKHGVAISMDGRGAWRDNVFVERLWRSVKYEEVYLRAYDSVSEARSSIGRYLAFYNHRRAHSRSHGEVDSDRRSGRVGCKHQLWRRRCKFVLIDPKRRAPSAAILAQFSFLWN